MMVTKLDAGWTLAAIAVHFGIDVREVEQGNPESSEVRTKSGRGLKACTTDKGVTSAQEIVDLFHDLEKLPGVRETPSDLKDVCLGFCFDPLSGLGALYANHR